MVAIDKKDAAFDTELCEVPELDQEDDVPLHNKNASNSIVENQQKQDDNNDEWQVNGGLEIVANSAAPHQQRLSVLKTYTTPKKMSFDFGISISNLNESNLLGRGNLPDTEPPFDFDPN